MVSRKKTLLLVVLLVALPVVALVGLASLGVFLVLQEPSTDGLAGPLRITAELRANDLVTAVQVERMASGTDECPSIEQLESDAFLEPGSTVDPWGTDYVIECDGDTVRVISLGPDHSRGTEDDVVVEDRPAS